MLTSMRAMPDSVCEEDLVSLGEDHILLPHLPVHCRADEASVLKALSLCPFGNIYNPKKYGHNDSERAQRIRRGTTRTETYFTHFDPHYSLIDRTLRQSDICSTFRSNEMVLEWDITRLHDLAAWALSSLIGRDWGSRDIDQDPRVRRFRPSILRGESWFRDDDEIARIILAREGAALRYMSDRLRQDPEVVLIAIQQSPMALDFYVLVCREYMFGSAKLVGENAAMWEGVSALLDLTSGGKGNG